MRFRLPPTGTDSNLTAWNAGRFDGRRRDTQLLFGQMYEDPCIEIDAFAGKERIFCIASAGCTAIALAAVGHQVTAVDVNTAQISYVEARLRGGDVKEGKADQLLARGRRFLPLFGWREPVLRQFLELENLAEQIEFWEAHLNTLRWRCMLDLFLHRSLLQIVYASGFTDSLPQHFGRKVRQRIERNWRTHANRSNPYAWRLLIGRQNGPSKVVSPGIDLRLTCADAATYLEDCPSDHFDGFTLSNIFDGASTEYRSRLLNAIGRTAAGGAVVVRRSFGEPADAQEEHWATRDKAMLWGSVSVTKIDPD